MRLKRKTNNETHLTIEKIILYILVWAFIISFVSSIVISIILSTSSYDLTPPKFIKKNPQHEEPVLGQFGPISTVILLIGIPFLILITTIAYAFYISASGITDKLFTF